MQIEKTGDKIIITIDVSETAINAALPSQSGKTKLIASTHGFRRAGNFSVSVNCTLPNAR